MIKKIVNLLKNPEFWFGILIMAGIIYFFNKPADLQVATTFPKDKTKGVLVSEKIIIVFNNVPANSEKNNIKIKSSPDQKFEQKWTNKTLVLSPNPEMKGSTSYTLEISSNNKSLYKFSFDTTTISYPQIQEDISKQAVYDYQFGQAQTDFYKKNPWYQYTPIETNDYSVLYDTQYNKFRIRILKDNPTSDEKKNIVNDAIAALKKIGVPEPISYYVLSKNQTAW